MDLEQLKDVLKLLLPKEKETIDKLIISLKIFFSKENIAIKIDNLKELPVLLDYLNKKIKDKEITKIIKNIKTNIKKLITALGKQEMDNVTIFQQELIQLIEKLTDNLNIVYSRRTPSAEKKYIIEASSYFRKQKDKSKVFDRGSAVTGIGKIKDYADAGLIPRKPQATEPHCYGGAPNHLNSVVMGKAGRLVFYMHPDESSNIIRLCAYIDAKTHNDAVNAVQERLGNIYWLINKHKINRLYFKEFKKINPENLKDISD